MPTRPPPAARSRAALWLAALLCAPLAAQAKGPGRGVDPARLANARFYEQEAAESIRKQTIDPLEHLDGVPWMAHFAKPGRLQLDYGQESETCAFTAEAGAPGAWTLWLRCGGAPRKAAWTWLDAARARTDLFDAGRPEGQERRTVEVQRIDKAFNAVLAEIERKFSDRAMAELAGKWADGAGAQLVLPKSGSASFDGARWAARVLTCQPDQEKPKRRARCLELAGPEEKSVVFAALEEAGALKLVEGTIPPDPAGRWFERLSGGRALSRVK